MYEWYASLGSVFWNLVADCPLVIFCNQQGHIGTNVKYLCGVTIPTHIMLSVALSRAELWIILSVIMVICIKKQTNWPYKQYYVKTSRFFYQRLNHLFFKCRRNLRCAGIQIRKILEDHLWRLYTYNIYIVTFISEFTKFIQLYICCKFDPIKETFWSARTPYLE